MKHKHGNVIHQFGKQPSLSHLPTAFSAWSGPSSSNAVWSTPSSSTIFSFQLLLVSYSLALGGSGGPPVLAFS